MNRPSATAPAAAVLVAFLLAVGGCASDPAASSMRGMDRGSGSMGSGNMGSGGSGSMAGGGGAEATEPPDLELAIDQLQIRGLDVQVTNLELDLGLRLSFLGIVTLDVMLDLGADELTVQLEELLGDVRADARIGALVTIIEDIVALFEENPDLLQRLQLRMSMGGGVVPGGGPGGGMVPGGGVDVPGGGGGGGGAVPGTGGGAVPGSGGMGGSGSVSGGSAGGG